MHRLAVMLGAGVLAAVSALPSASARTTDPLEYSPACSASGARPCRPMVCSLSEGPPCGPSALPRLAQELRATIKSRNLPSRTVPEQPINSLRELYTALRRCWRPPRREEAHSGMQMSVRFALKRSGEIIGPPQVTFASKDAGADTQELYRGAITAAIERCTPMPLSRGFGGALAGRPISIRFIDDRND